MPRPERGSARPHRQYRPNQPRERGHARVSSTWVSSICAGRLHARAPGSRSPLRSPDPPLEPEDEAVHLHRAGRDLHHRSPADLRAAPGGLRLRPQHREPRRQHPLRRHEEAGPGLDRAGGRARRDAVRLEPVARRPAHELEDDHRPDRAPARAAPPEDGGPARAAAREGADHDARRAREARVEPRRRRRPEAAAGRRLHRRPEEGAARRARGAAARPADHRARRHELRSGRGRLHHSGQRRRDPLLQPDRARDRRGNRRRQDPRHRGRADRLGGIAERQRRRQPARRPSRRRPRRPRPTRRRPSTSR